MMEKGRQLGKMACGRSSVISVKLALPVALLVLRKLFLLLLVVLAKLNIEILY